MRQRMIASPMVALTMRSAARLSAASFATRTLLLGILTLAVSGVAHAAAQPVRQTSDAGYLVESIVHGRADIGQVPDDFIQGMGYSPMASSGTLRNPRGGCSTPGQVGPDGFAKACQTHDLGYDLLRYAEAKGQRLEARARFGLDWRLYVDLMQTCETATCTATATAYYGAVTANSIRQGYKTPHAESSTPWMALVGTVIGLGVAGGRARPNRIRFDEKSPCTSDPVRASASLASGRMTRSRLVWPEASFTTPDSRALPNSLPTSQTAAASSATRRRPTR